MNDEHVIPTCRLRPMLAACVDEHPAMAPEVAQSGRLDARLQMDDRPAKRPQSVCIKAEARLPLVDKSRQKMHCKVLSFLINLASLSYNG